MDTKETLLAVIKQLKDLFKDKAELKGFDDWDTFIGCIIALEQIAVQPEEAEETEVDGDG